jgi:uncharacterized protein DUF4259
VVRSTVFMLLLLGGVSFALAGAWGFGSFENDDALDWVADLEHATGPQLLASTLQQIDSKAEHIEAPDCLLAFAAAEVVAAVRGHPAKTIPSEVTTWIKRVHPKVNADLLAIAHSAVMACRDSKNSELRDLWQHSKDANAWFDDTANLLQRLQ